MTWRIACSHCAALAEAPTCRDALARVMQHGPHPAPFVVTMTGRNDD